jgi:hypothetical protein
MAMNMALKRARKAQRRKLIVAEKRRAEALDASLPARVLRAAHTPIQRCLISEPLFEDGIGTVVLARGATPDYVVLSAFLTDVFCLGVKNVTFQSIDDDTFEMYLATMEIASPMVAVDPRYARKLLRDMTAWSQSIGFAPHPDFATVEQVFGDVNADACETVFRFGREGKPVYIPGPLDNPSLIQRRIDHLDKLLGSDGFDFETAA